jgi:hypothetical protein
MSQASQSNGICLRCRSAVLAVVVAQNVLMRKLGIAKDQHVESDDLEAYLKLFMDGL